MNFKILKTNVLNLKTLIIYTLKTSLNLNVKQDKYLYM